MSENNNEQQETVKIQLQRHKWPDEIKRERERRIRTIFITGALIASFVLGLFVNGALNTGTTIINGNTNEELSRFQEVYNTILNQWYFSSEMEDPASELIDNAINGMLELNGDIHTTYLTKQEALDFSTSINGEFVGIGVQYYGGNGINLITKVFKNSPAEKAGIKAGDILTGVDGIAITDENASDLVEMITGEKGTTVSITVQRGADSLTFDIVRDTVNSLAYGYMLDDGVAYLELTSFGTTLYDVTKAYLEDFDAQGATKLIIDLRGNGGGYLSAIEDVSHLFIPKGDVVYQTESVDGTVQQYIAPVDPEFSYDKIVILIDNNTASASEVLTLALKENSSLNVATVGTVSYGKGTAQTQKQLSDGGYLKYTYAKWLDPEGNNINGVGITPDQLSALDDFFYASYVELEDNQQLTYDTVGDGIAYIQKGLKFMGYNITRTDGYFDQNTLDSLKSFQKQQGLSETGVIDQDIIERVYSGATKYYYDNKATTDVQLLKAIEVIAHD